MNLSKKMLQTGAMLMLFVLLTVSCGDEKSPVAPAIDYRPPLIEWIAPASGADLVGITRLAFTILDDASGIDRFAVYRNGFAPDEWRITASEDTLYDVDWDTRDVPDDIYMLEVRAWDDSGNLGVSPALRVNVRNNQDPREDHTPPDLWWTAPVPGSTLSGETVLQIKFYDESGVDSVRLLKNGAVVTTLFCTTEQDGQDGQDLACCRTPSTTCCRTASTARCYTPSCDSSGNDLTGRRGRLPAQLEGHLPAQSHILANENGDSLTYLWDTSSDPDGVYVWEARAFDAAGNMGLSPSLLVKVRNSQDPPPDDRMPPVISWLSPEPGSEILGVVDLRFDVLDNIAVDSVKVYINGPSSEVFCLPGHEEVNYLLKWPSIDFEDGLYYLEVRAWDPSHNLGFGEPISLTVYNNRPRVIWVPDEFETIQDAINASKDGDTVRVSPGVYPGGIFFWDKNIWLESERGPELTIIDAENYNGGISIWMGQDTASCVRGFTIRNAGFTSISLSNGCSIKLLNNILVGAGNATVYAGYNSSIFMNNIFSQSVESNIQIWVSNGLFYNNMVIHSGRSAIHNRSYFENPIIIDYNLMWDYQLLVNLPFMNFGQNNLIDLDPGFVEDSYILENDSPAIDAGNPAYEDLDGTRSDIGIYGGPYAYPIP